MSKKIILTSAAVIVTSATVLFIGLTAFAKDSDKNMKKSEAKCDQTRFMEKSSFVRWGMSEDTVKMKCSGDSTKCKTSCKESEEKMDGNAGNIKDKASESKTTPRVKMYFMFPMADSAPVDTTMVGC